MAILDSNIFVGKDGKSFESVIMIPVTPHGELKKIVEKKGIVTLTTAATTIEASNGPNC